MAWHAAPHFIYYLMTVVCVCVCVCVSLIVVSHSDMFIAAADSVQRQCAGKFFGNFFCHLEGLWVNGSDEVVCV